MSAVDPNDLVTMTPQQTLARLKGAVGSGDQNWWTTATVMLGMAEDQCIFEGGNLERCLQWGEVMLFVHEHAARQWPALAERLKADEMGLRQLVISTFGPGAHTLQDPGPLEVWFFDGLPESPEAGESPTDVAMRVDRVRLLVGQGVFQREAEVARWVEAYPPLDFG